MSKISSQRRRRARDRLPARAYSCIGGLALLAALCACDMKRGPEPIAECTAYASAARTCLGSRVADRLRSSFAKPPEGDAERAVAKAQCIASAARLRRVCR